jgi:hypothetical protein
LGWYSFKWRNHDPAIGRFFNVDPLSEKFYYNSPYAFSENKVTGHRELEGLEAWPSTDEEWIQAAEGDGPRSEEVEAQLHDNLHVDPGGEKVVNGTANVIFGSVGVVGSVAYMAGTESVGVALGGSAALVLSIGEVVLGATQIVDGVREMVTGESSERADILHENSSLPGVAADALDLPQANLIDAGGALLPGALTGGNIKGLNKALNVIENSQDISKVSFNALVVNDSYQDIKNFILALPIEK